MFQNRIIVKDVIMGTTIQVSILHKFGFYNTSTPLAKIFLTTLMCGVSVMVDAHNFSLIKYFSGQNLAIGFGPAKSIHNIILFYCMYEAVCSNSTSSKDFIKQEMVGPVLWIIF